LLLLLPERIGSPLSINSLREDLEVNHKTVSNWLEAFKKIYLVFSIMPWSKGISRAIKKESKFYFYDWTLTDNNGQRFENMAAVMLLKVINRFNELGLGDFDLRYVRTKNGEEMDFLIIKDNRPFALFEAKRNETVISKAGHYFSQNLKVPYYQIVSDSDILESYPGDKYVVSAYRLFAITG
jgi:predicted AAA+ superfamily ATPase